MNTVIITGAFSYTGKHATRLLLSRGYQVRTLTFHPDRHSEFGAKVQAFPYNFEHPEELERSLSGASCLINTYWVRFPHGHSTFDSAVKNTITLINAAKKAGITRIVHVSIANPSVDSPLAYYRGKAELERAVVGSGLAYTILRPTVIFGLEDVLINNIAWFVRRLPVFGIPGDGRYRLRPIYVQDMAGLITAAVEKHSNEVIDAVGPETFTFEELVRLIATQLQSRLRIMHLPTVLAYLSTRLAGLFLHDLVLTWEEYEGLMSDLLTTGGPSTGGTLLSEWLSCHRAQLGRQYASELARHYR
ncbi:MAG TPA: NAD(P)H-binding protein [Candidatus Eremiobacteraceae bacterium]|nr:NAD(P)H-binding protein [Candidatus Eremiobacteraceae bacterium]